jgi:hypothetical protein
MNGDRDLAWAGMRIVAIRRFERPPRRAEHHATHAVYRLTVR